MLAGRPAGKGNAATFNLGGDGGKGGGKGLNEVGGDGQDKQNTEEQMGLGGGRGEESSNEWNYRGTEFLGAWAYSLEYDTKEDG